MDCMDLNRPLGFVEGGKCFQPHSWLLAHSFAWELIPGRTGLISGGGGGWQVPHNTLVEQLAGQPLHSFPCMIRALCSSCYNGWIISSHGVLQQRMDGCSLDGTSICLKGSLRQIPVRHPAAPFQPPLIFAVTWPFPLKITHSIGKVLPGHQKPGQRGFSQGLRYLRTNQGWEKRKLVPS